MKLFLRGDANGRVSIFGIPEVTENQLEQIQQLDFDIPPCTSYSSVLTHF